MKKLLFCFCSLIVILSASVFATDVQLNGEIIDFTDSSGKKVEAQIINNRTMVPLRKIFELLGCNVDWEASSQTITASKDNRKIILQINNKNAQKIVDGNSEKIELDSAPVIVNDRTLVPLRFIAESLNKQVGWDAANRTAIIIDYAYFENNLKSSAPALYYFLKDNYSGTKNTDVTITRKYIDNLDSKNNNTATITANISESKGDIINQNLKLIFNGNNPLMQDILKEKWNSSELDITYKKDGVEYTTSGVLATMIGTKGSNTYDELRYDTTAFSELEDAFRSLIALNENKLNIGTFGMVKQEFNKLCDLFNTNNSVEQTEDGTKYTWNFNTVALKYSNTDFNYFDLTKLDNIIYNNSYVRAYGIINKKIFNYDVKLDELMYDASEIKLNGKVSLIVSNGNIIKTDATIAYKAINDYSEQFEYIIYFNM